jgi:uracil-DNA glycosylase family 4
MAGLDGVRWKSKGNDPMEKISLEKLAKEIQYCRICERNLTRDRAVPGEGPPVSGMLLVGEAPGKKEDRAGSPFVGRSGKYLDKILLSNGLERNRMFITSVLKCYHPGSPKKHQLRKCLPWSLQQIDSLDPLLILIMGRWAAWALLGIEKLEDLPRVLTIDGKWWVVTCHPAAAMRFPRRNWEFRKGCSLFASKAAELDLR